MESFPKSAQAAATGWQQVNQDGFVKNSTPHSDGVNLVAFDGQLYAATTYGIFQLQDPLTRYWTP
jgi:hypothetical protein